MSEISVTEFWKNREPIKTEKRNLSAREAADFTAKCVLKFINQEEPLLEPEEAVQKGVALAHALGMFNLNQLYNALAGANLIAKREKGSRAGGIDGTLLEDL